MYGYPAEEAAQVSAEVLLTATTQVEEVRLVALADTQTAEGQL